MPDIADALVEDRHGTLISVEVTAGAKTSAFPAGYNEWRKAIGCRVTAPAVGREGKQGGHYSYCREMDVPASRVYIQSGATSSQKRVLVMGIDKKALLGRLDDS